MKTTRSSILLCVLLGFGFSVFLTACQAPDKNEIFKQEVKQSLEPFYEGEKLLAEKRLDEAKEKFQASLQISPRPKAYYRLAEIALVQNDLPAAQTNLDEALKLSPRFPQALQLKRQLDVRMQIAGNPSAPGSAQTVSDTTAAMPIAEADIQATELTVSGETPSQAVPALDPATISAESALSEMEDSAETPDLDVPKLEAPTTTVPEFSEVAAPSPSTPTLQLQPVKETPLDAEGTRLMDEAKKLGDVQNWADATAIYQRLTTSHPDNSVVWYNYGYAQYQQKFYEDAVKSFQRAVAIKPDFAEAYNDLGVALENLGKTTDAAAAYEKAIASGKHADAYFNLALLQEKQGLYTKAIENYNTYLQFDPNSAYSTFAKDRIGKLQRKAY